MKIPFLKMHGAGNDFVVVDHRTPFLPDDLEPVVARLCDRRRGVGADGVLLLERDGELDFAMRYFNADGRPAEYCGNGARCLARLAFEIGLGEGSQVRFRTAAGVQRARRRENRVELSFGSALGEGEACEVEACGRAFAGRLIRAGVPHFVTAVERVEWVPMTEWGPALRQHGRFAPEGANVDFVAPLGPGRVALRTFERGVESETLACGSGAIATALWVAAREPVEAVSVLTAGGDELEVALTPRGERYDVTITGPAEIAFRGEWLEQADLAPRRG